MEDPVQESPLLGIFSSYSLETNLLTSPDVVGSYLQDINDKLMDTQRQIHELVSQHSSEFTNTLNYCKDFKVQAATLNEQFTSVTEKISHPEKGLYSELVTAITNYHELQEELVANQTSIALLETIYTHYTTLSSYDNLYAARDYTQAATILAKAPEVQVGSLRIYAVLADEYRTRKISLKKVLQESLRNVVQVAAVSSNKRSGNILDKFTLHIHQSISSILQAIEYLGEKEYSAAFSYLNKVIGEFFSFLLSDPSNVVSFNQQNNEWSMVVEAGSKKLDHLPVPVVLQILSSLEQGLSIIARHLFEENIPFISKMGSLIWDSIVESMIKKILATSIPEDNSQLAEYKEVLSAIESLEQTVHKMGYITPENPKFSAMSKYAHDVDTHFALKKQRRLLSKARKLLINADHNQTITVGTPEPMPDLTKLIMLNKKSTQATKRTGTEEGDEEEMFLKLSAFPQCVVSVAAHSLVNLMHQALQAPLLNESRTLYNNGMVIRSVVDLFRIVYSSHHKHKLADVPQLSMVFHNDCFYIAQYISLMIQTTDKPENETCSFVDLVHSLRELGESSWLHAITKQIKQVNEGVEEMGGLADTQEAKRKHVVERGLKIIGLQLKSVSDTWRGVLPGHLFFTTMGILVDHLFSTLVRELELVEAIAEEESHILHALLQQIYQQGEATFKLPSQNNDRLTQYLLNKYVPQHTKLSKAVDLLEMPLVKIVEYHRNGLLDEFTPRELKNFIMCLFSDSPLRRQLLDQLLDGAKH